LFTVILILLTHQVFTVNKLHKSLNRDAGYNQICDRIFCQHPHIAYISAYNSIFKIAYAKIRPYMPNIKNLHIFAYIPHISAYAIAFYQHFLSNIVLRLLNIFGGKQLPVFTIRH